MGSYKKYSDQFKQEVLAMAAEGKQNISQLEHDLDITPGLIYKWQRRYQNREGKEHSGEEQPAQTTEAEIRRLKRELEIARQERDILKKALQVFSRAE